MKKKSAKKGKRTPTVVASATPVPVIFVGFAEPCLKKAAALGVQNPVIVNCFEKMEGRHGPLAAYVCGNYKTLPHWPAIYTRLVHMMGLDKGVTILQESNAQLL